MSFFVVRAQTVTHVKRSKTTKSTFEGSASFEYIDGNLVERPKKASKPKAVPNEESEPIIESIGTFADAVMNFEANAPTLQETPETPTDKEKKTYTINARKIKQRLFAYFNLKQSKQSLFFWTVTFPVHLPDSVAFKVYNIFLTRWRKELKLDSYLWVAERQANGTIHFHIIVNRQYQVNKVNGFMRAALLTLEEAGYVFEGNFKAEKYNGVDIAKERVGKVRTKRIANFANANLGRTLKSYITKYITKNQTEIQGRAWHCSRTVSALFNSKIVDYIPDTYFEQMNDLQRIKALYSHEYFTVIVFNDPFPPISFREMFEVNELILNRIENELQTAA